ncbi:MAG TPA: hypothetical protein VK148_15290 [Xanthobacteraceae bacterium]|nr:hypothetical protein [Xanthobacteraceae bacterium]
MAVYPHPTLPPIPVVDVRDTGLMRHCVETRDRARTLRDDCMTFMPPAARALLPMMDRITRTWLRRSGSPYVSEVEAIADAAGVSGVWFLNGCYQWGCTTLAREEAGHSWLARTLDWPFPGLGRHLEVARMRGDVGHFDNVTWPGFVGCLTASAPGRFAATINQAPMWRRTKHPWGRPYDMMANALSTWRIRSIPPDHLLRQIFETCGTYVEARRQLETTSIARPAIYTLIGCRRGEACVIERMSDGFQTRETDTGAANDWLKSAPRWEARISAQAIFTRSSAEAADNSRTRRMHLAAFAGEFARGGFGWVTPPVLNPYTRVAVEMCPARGVLRVVGFEMSAGEDAARPVTRVCEVTS